MTAFAADGGMCAQQGKHTQLMIKAGVVMPALFIVTLLTARAQRTLMCVCARMAAVTCLIRNGYFNIARMTLFTSYFLMCAIEWKIGFAVIKTGRVPLCY